MAYQPNIYNPYNVYLINILPPPNSNPQIIINSPPYQYMPADNIQSNVESVQHSYSQSTTSIFSQTPTNFTDNYNYEEPPKYEYIDDYI